MKLLDFISFLDHKKIEEGKICFKVFAFKQSFWFFCEKGKTYEEFVNGPLLGEGECLHDLELPEDFACETSMLMYVHTYNEDVTPGVIVFEIACDGLS